MTHPKNTQYQTTRKAALQQAAERDGFPNYSAAMTAWMKGEYLMIEKKEVEKVIQNTNEIMALVGILHPSK